MIEKGGNLSLSPNSSPFCCSSCRTSRRSSVVKVLCFQVVCQTQNFGRHEDFHEKMEVPQNRWLISWKIPSINRWWLAVALWLRKPPRVGCSRCANRLVSIGMCFQWSRWSTSTRAPCSPRTVHIFKRYPSMLSIDLIPFRHIPHSFGVCLLLHVASYENMVPRNFMVDHKFPH